MKASTVVKRFIPFFKKYRWFFVLDLLCASFTTLCDIALPLIVGQLTDLGIQGGGALTVEIILKAGFIYIGLRIIDSVAAYYMAYVGHGMGLRIETDMRHSLFTHLQQLSFSYFSHTKIGQIVARMTGDLFEVTEFAHHCPEEFLIAIIKVTVSFIVIVRMNALLAIVIFAVLPVMLVISSIFNARMRRGFRESRKQAGELNARVEDNLLGIRVVQSFTNEDYEKNKFDKENQDYMHNKLNVYRGMAGLIVTTRSFDGLMYIIVVMLGSFMVMKNKLTPGDLVSVLLFVSMLLTTIRRIVEYAEQFQKGITGIERYLEIIDEPMEIKDGPDAVDLKDVKGDIKFDHVGFHYADDPKKEVLADIDVHVKPGDSVALVGPSGSGKTTFCNLLPRFYEVSQGRILIDDQDINKFTLKSLRANIGMIQQEVYLFAGTVRDNIEYGKPGASMDEIVEAAKLANAHDFILELSHGYDSHIGERGLRLSGGQKQRLSIARAFLKNPPILILDEATSSLDTESERVVQQSLERLAEGRTTFTIAHRLTTIKNATVIWVLTSEGIVERGSHDELMAKKGLYYSLYNV